MPRRESWLMTCYQEYIGAIQGGLQPLNCPQARLILLHSRPWSWILPIFLKGCGLWWASRSSWAVSWPIKGYKMWKFRFWLDWRMSPIHIQELAGVAYLSVTKQGKRSSAGVGMRFRVMLSSVFAKVKRKAQKWKDRRTPMRHVTDRMHKEAR